VRIATWNVNGLRARLEFVLRWLAEREPDVVGLQELKVADEQFPQEALRRAGYQVATHGQAGWNGVAIASREPIEIVTRGLPGQEALGSRLVTARTAGLTFTSLYCPNGKSVEHPDFPAKLTWLDALARHLAEHGTEAPAIVGGDFNLCPAALDSWSEAALCGELFHTTAERERFAALERLGFRDLFRAAHPDLRAFSWWDYRGGAFHQGRGLRIDLVLGTPDVVRRLRSAAIDREYRKKQDGRIPSDHAPVIVELE